MLKNQFWTLRVFWKLAPSLPILITVMPLRNICSPGISTELPLVTHRWLIRTPPAARTFSAWSVRVRVKFISTDPVGIITTTILRYPVFIKHLTALYSGKLKVLYMLLSIHHLLNCLGSIHLDTCYKVLQIIGIIQ